MFTRLRQLFCRHTDLIRRYDDPSGTVVRLYCECMTCGRETPGWRVK